MLKLEKKNSKPPNKTQPAIFSSSRVVSRHRNLIAFQLEGSQLRRGLRGAAALAPEGVDLKLTLRPSAGAGGAGADLRGKPYLSIQARSGGGNLAGASYSSSLLAAVEIPISQPLYPSDIDALIAERDAPLMARFYVDLASSPGSSSTSPSAAHDAASAAAATGGGIPACSRLRVLADRVLALAPTLIDDISRIDARCLELRRFGYKLYEFLNIPKSLRTFELSDDMEATLLAQRGLSDDLFEEIKLYEQAYGELLGD